MITVVTAAHNASKYIDETIRSVVAQTFTDWEFLIVDDASTDDTADIADRWTRADGRIRLLRRASNDGPYVAANEGIASARGRYIARTDADDISVPERLEAQLDFLKANERLRACGSYTRNLTEDGSDLSGIVRIPESPRVLRWYFCAAGAVHSTLFADRAALDDVGGYKPELGMAADLKLWLDLAARDWVGMVPVPLVHWRVHGEGITGTRRADLDASGLHVAQGYVRTITGQEWTIEELAALRALVHDDGELPDAADVFRRWVAAWRSDDALAPSERWYLERWASAIRRRIRTEPRERMLAERAGDAFRQLTLFPRRRRGPVVVTY